MAAHLPDLPGPSCSRDPRVVLGGRTRAEPDALLGGLLGGTWLTSLAGDLGGGLFDGASHLEFRSRNPANTYWKKQYDFIPTRIPRSPYLEFEKWWGAPVL